MMALYYAARITFLSVALFGCASHRETASGRRIPMPVAGEGMSEERIQWLAAHFRSEYGNNVVWDGPLHELEARKDIPSDELDRWSVFAAEQGAREFYVIYEPIHIIGDSFPGTSEKDLYDAFWIVVMEGDTTVARYHIGDRPNESSKATPGQRQPATPSPRSGAPQR